MRINYNERSWAIDLIAEIKRLAPVCGGIIKGAGGEKTLRAGAERFFPDVLIYADETGAKILQGWELKMPDTPVTDESLLANARKKAELLGLNSFLVWNVAAAVLHVADAGGVFASVKHWTILPGVQRNEVEDRRAGWTSALRGILRDLNEFFEKGLIRSRVFVETFSDLTIAELIQRNFHGTARHLRRMAAVHAEFAAEVESWWGTVKQEYSRNEDKWHVLAKRVLMGWSNKFVFAHVLKTIYAAALKVESLGANTALPEAARVFRHISEHCDFWNVFSPATGEEHVPEESWREILQLNAFLAEIQLGKLDAAVLWRLLQTTVEASRKKIAGQYVTPVSLAAFLSRVAIGDKTKSVLDPFCGTGTIIRAAYELKREYGLPVPDISKTIWASDKFSFPVQITTLALSAPDNMGQLQHVSRHDVIDLHPGEILEFFEPSQGQKVAEPLPRFDYILSNLPFVRFENVMKINPEIDKINDWIKTAAGSEFGLQSKSDLYAYLPFYLWKLLAEEGRLGIIISNAWLGTGWGRPFREALRRFFVIEKVIVSGRGRWFKEADVVASLLILKKRARVEKPAPMEEVAFATLEVSAVQLAEPDCNREAAAALLKTADAGQRCSSYTYTYERINEIENLGLEWGAFFSDLAWLAAAKKYLAPISRIFTVKRGERRGGNQLFYPPPGHNIEREYIRPVLKSSRNIRSLVASADAEAFCCFRSLEELEQRNHGGALAWIRKFENAVDGRGRPLPERLRRAGYYWYQMKESTFADLVVAINPGDRLFVARVDPGTFVDQRFACLSLKNPSGDVELYHALLNSVVGVFCLEAMGFGRGLGVLDLNSDKMKRQYVLNPEALDESKKRAVKEAFDELIRRPVLPILQELEKDDRRKFDEEVLKAFGLSALRDDIVRSFKALYRIRMSVKDKS